MNLNKMAMRLATGDKLQSAEVEVKSKVEEVNSLITKLLPWH